MPSQGDPVSRSAAGRLLVLPQAVAAELGIDPNSDIIKVLPLVLRR
jgi:hypothetical protein